MSTDTWLHTVRQLCSEVDRLTAILDESSNLDPKLRVHDTGEGWELVVEWTYDDLERYCEILFEDRVEWITKQLKKQKNCFRADSGAWRFYSKRDAEQFLTLYYLKWSSV